MNNRSNLAVVSAGLIAAGPHAALAAELLIENVTVISPEQANPQPSRHVLIRDGRIVAVNSQRISAGRDAQRIDGSGKFLAPGLMDSHLHVGDAAGLPFADTTPQLAALRAAYFRQQPRSYLYFGVTQVIDLSSTPQRLAVFEAQPQRPDVFRCGPAVVLGGYPTVFLPSRRAPPASPELHLRAGERGEPSAACRRRPGAAHSGIRRRRHQEENPLQTMRAWTLIDKVIRRGDVIERETLAADAPGAP